MLTLEKINRQSRSNFKDTNHLKKMQKAEGVIEEKINVSSTNCKWLETKLESPIKWTTLDKLWIHKTTTTINNQIK